MIKIGVRAASGLLRFVILSGSPAQATLEPKDSLPACAKMNVEGHSYDGVGSTATKKAR